MNEDSAEAARLLDGLEKTYRRRRTDALALADQLGARGRNVLFRQLDPQTLLTVEISGGGHGTVTLALDFPFPIASRSIDDRVGPSVEVVLRRVGPSIERLQLLILYTAAARRGWTVEERLVSSPDRFRELVAAALRESRQFTVFADRFTYLGDAVQHLREHDTISSWLPGRRIIAATEVEALRGRMGFGRASAHELCASGTGDRRNLLVVAPCYVGSHWRGIVDLSMDTFHKGPDSTILIPGRNAVLSRSGRIVEHVRLVAEDHTLARSPVEPMVDAALEAFRRNPGTPVGPLRRPRRLRRILLAPWASHVAKQLPIGVLTAFVERFARLDLAAELVLLSGDPRDVRQMAEFSSMASALPQVDAIEADIDAAIALVESSGFVVAADSSVSHFARRFGVPCATVYRDGHWDDSSSLSMLHRSVVGFGTTRARQYHLVVPADPARLAPVTTAAIGRLAELSLGGTPLDPAVLVACRTFVVYCGDADAAAVAAGQERLHNSIRSTPGDWLLADLPITRLLRPFKGSQADAVASWLARISIAAKLATAQSGSDE